MPPFLWGLGFSAPDAGRLPVPSQLRAEACAGEGAIFDLPLRPAEKMWSVAVGRDAVFAVTSSGRVLSWGCSTHGRLGVDMQAPGARVVDTPDLHEVAGLGLAVQVSSSSEHALAVNSDGHVFAWGSSLAGRLGIGNRASVLPCRDGHLPYTRSPERVQFPANKRVTGVVRKTDEKQKFTHPFFCVAHADFANRQACGEIHCMALTHDGHVYAWGSASMGRLGLGSDTATLTRNGEALVNYDALQAFTFVDN